MDGKSRCWLVVWLVLVGASPAQAFTDLFVFGDSLSDVGNTHDSTWGVYPGSTYHSGRFSNGPVYSELLSVKLGLGNLTRSETGGDNFAFGGAKTSGSSWVTGAFLNDLGEQVDEYIAERAADPEALYIVWAGANDLFDGQTDMSVPVGNIATDIKRLYDFGARELLVMNLPKLGATPAYNTNSTTAADWNFRTFSFNTQLDTALDELTSTNTEMNLRRFDIEGLFDDVLANPGEYGLTNITQAAAPELEPGAWFYNKHIVPNPEEYLFWDTVHPTATMHAALADAIYKFLVPDVLEGDYNADGVVDLADYTVWRDTLGAPASELPNDIDGGTVGAAQYATWKTNFGESTSGAAQSAAVPEPSTALLLAVAAVLLCARCGSRRRVHDPTAKPCCLRW